MKFSPFFNYAMSFLNVLILCLHIISTYLFSLCEQLQLILPSGAQGKSFWVSFLLLCTNYHKSHIFAEHTFIISQFPQISLITTQLGSMLNLTKLQSDAGRGCGLIRGLSVKQSINTPHSFRLWRKSSSRCTMEVPVSFLPISWGLFLAPRCCPQFLATLYRPSLHMAASFFKTGKGLSGPP